MSSAIREPIFSDDRPFAQCHASTLAADPADDQRFLAAWFGGSREGQRDVGIWLATRTAAGWSAPRALGQVRDSPHWNPVLLRAPDGAVHLWFKVGDTIPAWSTWTCVSHDFGATWSEPRELVPGDRGGRGPVKNPPLILAHGDWLAGASVETQRSWDVFVDRSLDGGASWHAGGLLARHPDTVAWRGMIQPTLWESTPGRVHMLTRSTGGRVCRSDSADGGLSWSPLAPTDLPHNNIGLCAARLADGDLVLCCNPVTQGRTPLTLLLSGDNGATWRRWIDLETSPGEYSYPTVIALGGRQVAVSYTWRRERIVFWRGEAPAV
jgi:predicted neuraminidase